MRFNSLRTKVILIVSVVWFLAAGFFTFYQIRYSMHPMDEVLEDVSATREVVVRAYSDDGSYEDRGITDPDAVREICDTVLSLKLKVNRFKPLKGVVYELCFIVSDGETLDVIAVASESDLIDVTETTFRIKSEFEILEYARGLFAGASAN